MIYTVHTGGRDVFKPRVHLVMPRDGLNNGKWMEIGKLPGDQLSTKWRYLLCKNLRQALPSA